MKSISYYQRDNFHVHDVGIFDIDSPYLVPVDTVDDKGRPLQVFKSQSSLAPYKDDGLRVSDFSLKASIENGVNLQPVTKPFMSPSLEDSASSLEAFESKVNEMSNQETKE